MRPEIFEIEIKIQSRSILADRGGGKKDSSHEETVGKYWASTSLKKRGGSYHVAIGINLKVKEQGKLEDYRGSWKITGEVGRLQGKLEDYRGNWKTTWEVGRLQILPMERRGRLKGSMSTVRVEGGVNWNF